MRRSWTWLAFLAALFIPAAASASPWVLREDQLVVSGRFDFQQADREFLKPGEVEPYSLNGRYRAATYETSVRLGLVDRLELQLHLPLKQVSYRADPVVLLPCPQQAEADACFQQSQENVISLSRTTSGLADIRLGARYQFLKGPVAGALGLELKTPTGYERPAGTFGREPKDAQDFKENVATYVQPDNVQDDVTLGDGQLDLNAMVHWGWSLPSRTYARLDTGYRLRMGGAADQVLADFQIGQQFGDRYLIKAGANFEYAVEEGEVIGISVAAEDPTLPAEDYVGTENLRLREIPLGYDRLRIHGGMLIRVTQTAELNLSYARVLWGRNTALTQTVSLGLGFKFDISEES